MKGEPPRIVVVGSLHYDIVVDAERQPERGETLIGSAWQPKFGGKGGNQALAARSGGPAVALIGAVGRDAFGDVLLAGLRDAGIDASGVARIDAVGSGMSVAIADADGDYAAVVVSGANRLIDPAVVGAAPQLKDASVLILQNELPEAVNLVAARAAASSGAAVIWNAAPARPDCLGLSALTDILVVNVVEARQFTGITVDGPETALEAAQAIRTRGIPTVIVTLGSKGLAAIGRDGIATVIPGLPVPAPKAHGAGDAFVGTLAAAFAKSASLPTALDTANRAAADHVGGSGQRSMTLPGMYRL
jgi:ribokinase